jgi:hypothetical protein
MKKKNWIILFWRLKGRRGAAKEVGSDPKPDRCPHSF